MRFPFGKTLDVLERILRILEKYLDIGRNISVKNILRQSMI